MNEILTHIEQWCKEWTDKPGDYELIIQDTDTQKAVMLRMMYAPDDWYWINSATYEKIITEEDIRKIIAENIADKLLRLKLLITTKGFTQQAGILASQHNIIIAFLAFPTATYTSFSYRIPIINQYHIQTQQKLNEQEWQHIHFVIAESKRGYEKAVILNTEKNKIYDFKDLEAGLSLDDFSGNNIAFNYDMPGYFLVLNDKSIAINGIGFNYFTELKNLNTNNEAAALKNLLELYIFR